MHAHLKRAKSAYHLPTSEDKPIIRHKIVEGAVRASEASRKAGLLRQTALTLPAAEAKDALMLAWSLPTVDIVAVEGLVPAFQEMCLNVPAGTLCIPGRLEEVISTWGTIAGTTGDSHMISANFDFIGFLDCAKVVSLMEFVADHRFVKPGGTTLLATTFKEANRKEPAIREAYARTLGIKEKAVENTVDMTTAYVSKALLASCPKLGIKLVDARRYRNSDKSVYMHSVIFEISKPKNCPEFEIVTTGMQGRWHRGVFIPRVHRDKDAPAIRVRKRAGVDFVAPIEPDTVKKTRKLQAAPASMHSEIIAKVAPTLTKGLNRVLRRAASGASYPRTGDKDYPHINAGLKAYRRGTEVGLMFGGALMQIRPNWTGRC